MRLGPPYQHPGSLAQEGFGGRGPAGGGGDGRGRGGSGEGR